jgi:2-keto-3-deoxy-L-rhamnonate aldolase RhmA
MTRLDEVLQREQGGPLLGMVLHRCNPDFVEIAAMLGFQVLWIEMEHAPVSFAEATELCRVASLAGMLTMVRIPDARRENVLRAAECGPDIIDLPMANSPLMLQELVRHAFYPPRGERGFYCSSRAERFSAFGTIADEQRRVNGRLALAAQIESREAVAQIESICQVEDVQGIFLGLGDLSASLGTPGETGHRTVCDAVERVVGVAKQYKKRLLVPSSPAEAGLWAQRGADVLFLGSDTGLFVAGARELLRGAKESIARTRNP